MDQTHYLELPYLASHQSQKHVTLNEALTVLDLVVHASVSGVGVEQPPAAAEYGERFLVGTDGEGAFAGQAYDIAVWLDGGWRFYSPKAGWMCWDDSEQRLLVFSQGEWVEVTPEFDTSTVFGVNTQGDSSNRLAVKSDAVLLSHDDVTPGSGDMRLQLNRASVSNTASMIFSTAYSGQVELALQQAGRFAIRREDGQSGFVDALAIDVSNGEIECTDPLILSPANPTEGTVLMRFNIDREWQLEQYRNGSTAGLAFRATVNGRKSFSFLNEDASREVRITPDEGTVEIDGHAVLHRGDLDPDALKTGAYASSGLPSAASSGAGTLVLINDALPNPRLAYSDGADWRFVDSLDVV